MGDQKNKINLQAKPKIELEDLYQGIPDESVNLTFQDLADFDTSEKVKPTISTIEPISEVGNPTKPTPPSLVKLPSLDFNKGLQACNQQHHHHLDGFGHGGTGGDSPWGHRLGHHVEDHVAFSHASGGARSPRGRAGGDGHLGYDDHLSVDSGRGGGRRRRPGIPHSKICTICSTYIYLFRTRCLVCGRVYCRQCVGIGMGEMIEGRKCIECLGLRFSQRYIERAGKLGCCGWRYPSTWKQAELKCAEKGPRRSGHRSDRSGYDHNRGGSGSGMASSMSRSPVTPRSPRALLPSNEPSFVMSSSYSPFSPHHFPL